MLKLLNNKTFILASAFIAGLLFGEAADFLSFLTLPALALVLTVSSTQVTFKDFTPPGRMLRPLSLAFAFNYLLLSSVIIFLAWWLMPSEDLWIGYVLLAAAPPGIAVVPFTYVLKGDIRISLIGTFGVYLLSILLTPIIIFLFTGAAEVSPLRLVSTMVQLILIPFFLAQVLRKTFLNNFIAKIRSNIINWGFFIVIFTVVGVNSEVFLSKPEVLLPVSVVAIISSFGLGIGVELVSKILKLPKAEGKSLMLLSSIKTSAFASAVALSLFSREAAIPGAVISAWYALYFIFLGIKGERQKKVPHLKQ